MVVIANSGNAADTNGFGAVSEIYRIGRFELTNAEYIEFLNAVAADDPNGLYDVIMTTSLRGVSFKTARPAALLTP